MQGMQAVMFLLDRFLGFLKDNILNSLLVLLIYVIKRSFDDIIIKTEAIELQFANYINVQSESLTVVEKQILREEIDHNRTFLIDSFQKISFVFLRDNIFQDN